MDGESLRIDPEFASLLPPLCEEERAGLEQSIIADGCLHALTVWDEESILVDGHNRHAICTEHGVKFSTVRKSFSSREEAKLWALSYQVRRRNLSKYQRFEIALKMEPLIAEESKKRMVSGRKSDPKQKSAEGQTRDKVADLAGISHATYEQGKRIDTFATEELKQALRNDDVAINAAAQIVETATPELQQALATGSVSTREAKRLAKLDAESQRAKLTTKPEEPASHKTRSEEWTTDELVDRVEDILGSWGRVCFYGKLFDDKGKVNEAAVKKFYKIMRKRMADLADWKSMLGHFLGPIKVLHDLAAEELGGETKRRRK